MNVLSVLTKVSALLPVAQQVLEIVNSFGGNNRLVAISEETLNIIGRLTPIAVNLINQIELIRMQTESDYPEVWAKVREPWKAAVKEFNEKYPDAV